ncbi:MAG: cytochrome b N-terminal domain-containing protein [Alphaproteobacteria bacterium]|nr:cytochrome b N-terminal domain-containing protein [Alphaproteobacteria bacterium]
MASGKRESFDNPVVEWIDSRLPLFTLMNKEYGVFPVPKNFNYFWNFGAIASFMLITMIVTGIILAMQYTANIHMAFDSVERIMRDVNFGWLIRYIHMNGASFFFIAVYIHIFRGMFYGSYKAPREILWILGVIIFLLMMATAFIGYVLPWGQMSYWGATVITNLFSAFPIIGEPIVTWLWGGFSVDNPTLNRFFALHYLLPFIIFAVVFLHVWALHVCGSNNPLGIEPQDKKDTLPFHPYYTMKDSFGLLVFLILFCAFVFFMPDALGHPDNYIPANPLVTPAHIVPEWYFLPFYAILRAITFDTNLVMLGGFGLMFMPFFWNVLAMLVKQFAKMDLPRFKAMTPKAPFLIGGLVVAGAGFALSGLIPLLTDVTIIEAKLGGVLAMFGAIVLWIFMPWLDSHPVRSAMFRPVFKTLFLILVVDFIFLGYVGSQPADAMLVGLPLSIFGLIATAYYFAFFVVVLPILSVTEQGKPLPKSIHDAVLSQHKAAKAAKK